ncbi:MAG: DUF3829 domain-containing protein [Myxococcales bacterium]|nr:DUF3829 domain-containing protein [Myxococcales bacterium]
MSLVRHRIITAVIVAAALAGGCKKPNPAAKDQPEAEGSTKDLASDRSMQVMNYYVEYFNDMIGELPSLTRNYWDRAGDAGLDVETMTKWGNVICAGTGWMKMKRDKAKERVAQVERQSSGEFAKMPPLAKAMFETAVAYADQRDAMCAYVKGGGFKADSGAKAKAIHDDLGKARDTFDASVEALATELERIEDAQSNAELAKHEAAKSYGYWFRFATIRANEFLRLARRDAVKGEAVLPQLEEAMTGFAAFTTAQGAKAHASFVGFGKQVERMQKAIAKLKPALAKAKTPAAKDAAIAAAMDDLLSIYNTMVSLHNTLIGLESTGQLK